VLLHSVLVIHGPLLLIEKSLRTGIQACGAPRRYACWVILGAAEFAKKVPALGLRVLKGFAQMCPSGYKKSQPRTWLAFRRTQDRFDTALRRSDQPAVVSWPSITRARPSGLSSRSSSGSSSNGRSW
jgi:hypothetical protein